MTIRVGINGFGRIGRLVMRAIIESDADDIEVVGINDLGEPEFNAYLLRKDSVHGRLQQDVTVDGDTMNVGKGPIKVTAERDPSNLPWGELGVGPAPLFFLLRPCQRCITLLLHDLSLLLHALKILLHLFDFSQFAFNLAFQFRLIVE